VLFRTASAAFGPRVIGVVLSGYQDCGTAGMLSIKARGGLSVVQDPQSALAAEMPRSVLNHMTVDQVFAPHTLGDVLTDLVFQAAPAPKRPVDRAVRQIEGKEPGARAELVCPTCQGVLTEAEKGTFQHFRCHVGHAFSLESLVREQGEEMERALWAAVRSLEESAALSGRLATIGSGQLRRRFSEKARTQCYQAELLRQILIGGDAAFRADETTLEEEPESPTPP
jgi:two-component system chemotaxis response regulator CheB